jgi:hypothetical protein
MTTWLSAFEKDEIDDIIITMVGGNSMPTPLSMIDNECRSDEPTKVIYDNTTSMLVSLANEASNEESITGRVTVDYWRILRKLSQSVRC